MWDAIVGVEMYEGYVPTVGLWKHDLLERFWATSNNPE